MEVILSRIQVRDKNISDNEVALYYRSEEKIQEQDDGSFGLKANATCNFTAYNNLFPLLKWKKYTCLENLSLVIEAKGIFTVNILNYNSFRTSKEVIDSATFTLYKKEKVEINIPINDPFDIVSFEIKPTAFTKLFKAYYKSDVKKENYKEPNIAVITSVKDTYNSISNNIFSLSSFISEKNSDKKPVSPFLIFDPNKLLDYDYEEFSNVTIVRDLDKDENDYLQKMITYAKKHTRASHFFVISDRISLDKEALLRVYSFLSIIKKEYKHKKITSFIFDYFTPNILITDAGRIDLNNIENLIKSECSIDIGDNNCNWYFSCLPATIGSNDHPWPFPYYKTGELKNTEVVDKPIVLNGVSCFTKEVDKDYSDSFNLFETDWKDYISLDGGYKLQEILFPGNDDFGNIPDMFYRSERPVKYKENGEAVLEKNTFYDFSTYFNSFSIEKWKKYTYAGDIWLEICASGKFRIELMGHYINESGEIIKECLGKHEYCLEQKRKITIPMPPSAKSSVVFFQIHVFEKDVIIYSGNYSTKVDKKYIKHPKITLATTTFQKESFITKNVKLLNDYLFSISEYKDSFKWIIVDNGRSLNHDAIENECIKVFENKNTGGAGGFSRGIIEANHQEEKPTHILLMDDDVLFMPDSFKRIYRLLSLIRPAFEKYFISGAMLEMDEKNIQHEDVGKTNPYGEHGPVKSRYDLNLWDSVVLNEKIIPDDPHQYAGWWYCCIPSSIARLDNLPLPVFIRGDDIEYSFRNHANFITMNGICIWHKGFGNKFSAALEFYQVHRNDLILHAINRHVCDVDIIRRIINLFWQEIYKFNYKGASLLTDAIEDYLKGPEFIKSLDGEKCMKSKKSKDNVLLPITPDIEALVDRESLYEDIPLGSSKKKLYDYSYNGQLLPNMKFRNKIGIIPYGWGYYPGRQYMATTIYAIDPINNVYTTYKKSNTLFKRVSSRFNNVMKKYYSDHKRVAEAYRKASKEITNETYWNNYLKGP